MIIDELISIKFWNARSFEHLEMRQRLCDVCVNLLVKHFHDDYEFINQASFD